MSWLNRVRNSIPFLPKRETPENLWHKCPECEAMVFSKEYEDNLYVCPRCDHHGRIGPTLRFDMLLDPGYTVLPPPQVREDPLKFRDSKRYSERIKAARAATGEPDALINARGAIEGNRLVLGVQDFAFMGGSMGMAVGAAFVAGARAAIEDRSPYAIVTAAGGARMQKLPEGFQRAEYLLDHGMVDMVVHRKDLRARLALLLDYLTPRREAA